MVNTRDGTIPISELRSLYTAIYRKKMCCLLQDMHRACYAKTSGFSQHRLEISEFTMQITSCFLPNLFLHIEESLEPKCNSFFLLALWLSRNKRKSVPLVIRSCFIQPIWVVQFTGIDTDETFKPATTFATWSTGIHQKRVSGLI